MTFLFVLLIAVGAFDWYSTAIQGDWRVEENPLARLAWQYGGDYGLLAQKLLFTALFIVIIDFSIKRYPKLKPLLILITLAFIGLTLLITLTNLAWIDYKWTAWLAY